jgi:hypothetical protein
MKSFWPQILLVRANLLFFLVTSGPAAINSDGCAFGLALTIATPSVQLCDAFCWWEERAVKKLNAIARVAYHEAGHSVMTVGLGISLTRRCHALGGQHRRRS